MLPTHLAEAKQFPQTPADYMLRTTCFLRILALVIAIALPNSLPVQSACGDIVTFDLGLNGISSVNGLDLDGNASASTIVVGSTFTVTMTAATQTNSVFLLHNLGLGINSVGNDRQNEFDDRNVSNEGMDFSFLVSQPATITVTSIQFQALTGSGNPGEDLASLSFSGGGSYSISGSSLILDQFSLSELYTAGQNISLAHVDGSGFRIQSITLDIQLTSVPECPPLMMLGCMTGFVVMKRRRRI